MSKISEMYEQIKHQQHLLIKTKLQEAMKANPDRKKLTDQEKQDYQFSDEEIGILIGLLNENGLEFYEHSESDYDGPSRTIFIMKADDKYIRALTDDWGRKDIPSIVDLNQLRESLDLFFTDEEIEEELRDIITLPNIDIDSLEIAPSSIIRQESVDDYKLKAIEAKENLVKAKIVQSIKDLMGGKHQSRDNSLYRDNEIYILLDMLK